MSLHQIKAIINQYDANSKSNIEQSYRTVVNMERAETYLAELLLGTELNAMQKHIAMILLNYIWSQQYSKGVSKTFISTILDQSARLLNSNQLYYTIKEMASAFLIKVISDIEETQHYRDVIVMINFLMSSPQEQTVRIGAYLYHALCQSDYSNIQFANFIEGCYPTLTHSFFENAAHIQNLLNDSNNKQQYRAIESRLRLLLIQLQAIYTGIDNAQDRCQSKVLVEYVTSQYLNADLEANLLRVVRLKLLTNSQPAVLFSMCGIQPIDKLFNDCKYYALYMLQLLTKGCIIKQYQTAPVLEDWHYLSGFLVDSLIEVLQHKDQYFQRYQMELVATMAISLLTEGIHYKPLYPFYQQHCQKILYDIVFTGLKIEADKIHMCDQSPDDFFELESTIFELESSLLDQQKFKLKNTINKFLNLMATSIDPCASICFQSAIEILKYILLGTNSSLVESILKQFKYKPTIESILTVFTLLTPIYTKRPQFNTQLYDLMSIGQFMDLKDLEKARLLQFFTYNFSNFSCDKTIITDVQKRILSLAASVKSEQKQIVRIFAIDFLSANMESIVGNQIWKLLVNQVENTNLLKLFETIDSIFQNHLHLMRIDDTMDMLQALIVRLRFEYINNYQNNKNTDDHSILFKIINIVETIASDTRYLKTYPVIRKQLELMFGFFEEFDNITFSDEIIRIYYYTIRSVDQISQSEFIYVSKYFGHIMSRQQNSYQQLLMPINYVILHSNCYIREYKNELTVIIELIEAGFANLKENVIGEACLLSQNVIITFGDLISNWSYIIEITENLIFTKKLGNALKQRIMNIWLLGYPYCQQFSKNNDIILESVQGIVGEYNIEVAIYAIRNICKHLIDADLIIQFALLQLHRIEYLKRKEEDEAEKVRSLAETGKYAKKSHKYINKVHYRENMEFAIQQMQLPIYKQTPAFIVKQTLKHLQSLPNSQSILQQIQSQIPMATLKDLMTFVEISSSVRRIVKVKKINLE